MSELSALKAIADSATDASSQTATVPLDGLKALLAVVEAAEAHCYHVNEEWDRVAAMRPQDPEVWERWENERERMIDVTRAALAALHDTEGR